MRWIALSLGLTVLAAGCGTDGDGGGSRSKQSAGARKTATEPADRRAPKPRSGAPVGVMRTRYGRILVDSNGKALYLFTRDRGPASRCHGGCADAWPPFVSRGAPRARGAARPSLLGTTARGNARQVTYRGHPLYYYQGDRLPGQVLCQAVQEFGGYWYVVAPNGTAIR